MAALFQPPPPEPDLRRFDASGSPADRGSLVSAVGIAPTSTATPSIRLAPFALWTAFPPADCYGASVAVGVAPGRPSRVPCAVDVQGGFGAPFVPLTPLQAGLLPGACSPRSHAIRGVPSEALDVDRCFQAETFTDWALRFKPSSLHHATRVSPGLPVSDFRASRLSWHAVVPSGFPHQVGQVTQRYHAQPLPCCTGINYAVTRRTVAGQRRRNCSA
jgi:hypothetical protein